MSDTPKKVKLTPIAEGLIGAVAGILIGLFLWYWNVISAPAVAGVALGLGLGSWFNAWRRARDAAKDKGEKP